MARYEHMFDIFDNNHDSLEYTTDELNRYYMSGHLSTTTEHEEEEEDIVEEDYFIINANDDKHHLQVRLLTLTLDQHILLLCIL